MKKLFFYLCLSVVINTTAQIVNIPDSRFKARLLAANTNAAIAVDSNGNNIKIDANNDSQIQLSEALAVYSLDVQYLSISDLTGIEEFVNLRRLQCSGNNINSLNLNNINLVELYAVSNQLEQINISNCVNLRSLHLHGNLLTELDVSNNGLLVSLNCNNNYLTNIELTNLELLQNLHIRKNQLTNLDVSNNMNLRVLHCDSNQLTSLHLINKYHLLSVYTQNNLLTEIVINNSPLLVFLNCSDNYLNTLNLSNCGRLYRLFCNNNLITHVEINELHNLISFECANNHLTELDVSNLHSLEHLTVMNNELELLNIKNNGNNWTYLEISLNPNLNYICVNDHDFQMVQDLLDLYDYSNCNINSFCSYGPSQELHATRGKIKFDYDNDGCDNSFVEIPNMRMTIGNYVGEFYSNSTGDYLMNLFEGDYSIHPNVGSSNPEFLSQTFMVTPPVIPIVIENVSDTIVQDYCVQAQNQYSNVDVAIIPLEPFISNSEIPLRLIYRNRGTTIENGTVSISFNQESMMFNSSTHIPSIQLDDYIEWNFTDLLPFETREIDLILSPRIINLNVLTLQANISIQNTDLFADDNIVHLNQTIHDYPISNSKLCIEGEVVSTDEIGKYVHYLIFFESTEKQNIDEVIIRDEIDLSKFDIQSLIPISGSHPFFTRVHGNKVEFIFKNIIMEKNGYVLFKIKTNSNLTIGQTFSNYADIYFDYDFPITTNTYTTSILIIGLDNPLIENELLIYPNPATNFITIDPKSDVIIESVDFHDMLGKNVFSTKQTNKIDIKSLQVGTYILNVTTDKGTGSVLFIKK